MNEESSALPGQVKSRGHRDDRSRGGGGAEDADAESPADASASLGAELKQAAQATSKAVRKHAATFAREVGHELGETADRQQARGAEVIQAFSRAMTAAAGELREQSPMASRYARDAAQSIESLSRSIKDQ